MLPHWTVVCHLYQAELPRELTWWEKVDICQRNGLQPVPVAEGSLCRFVAFLQVIPRMG